MASFLHPCSRCGGMVRFMKEEEYETAKTTGALCDTCAEAVERNNRIEAETIEREAAEAAGESRGGRRSRSEFE